MITVQSSLCKHACYVGSVFIQFVRVICILCCIDGTEVVVLSLLDCLNIKIAHFTSSLTVFTFRPRWIISFETYHTMRLQY